MEDTLEQKVLDLQEKKKKLAMGVLTGAKRTGANKLTLAEMKSLFEK